MIGILALLKHRSIQVVLGVALYLLLASALPLDVHRGLYAISLSIKDCLLWVIPISMFFFIASAISSFEKRAPVFILILIVFEALSNLMSVAYSFGWGNILQGFLKELVPFHSTSGFTPLWRIPISRPIWWSADKGTYVGIAVGLLGAFRFPLLRSAVEKGKVVAEAFITKIFSRLIPLFILGLVARMVKTQVFKEMFTQYFDFLIALLLCIATYIFILFFVGSGFSLKGSLRSIRSLLPAGGMALSSGCSLSTMPWTIEGASKNLINPHLAKVVIPVTTNIQQIGDCIANTFLCYFLYLQFNGHAPSLAVWVPFSFVFVLARFATAAVLGGAIFIMIPIYESLLGFTPEMIAIVLAVNVILDPLITSSNVVANGALCRIFEATWLKIFRRIPVLK